MPGVFEGEGLLKNLSITGCCIECTTAVDIKGGAAYQLQIIPESLAGIGSFELTVESRWIRTEGYSCEIGFTISAFPKGKLFQRYVDYLSWRANSL